MLQLIRLLVEFTPTQKDDEVFEMIESFLSSNPELSTEILSLLIKVIKLK